MRGLWDRYGNVCDQGVGSQMPPFLGHCSVTIKKKKVRRRKKRAETRMRSTHVGESDSQLMTWMGIAVNLLRMQWNLMEWALTWPGLFTGISLELLNLSLGLLALCNLLQNPCVTLTSPFCRITELNIDLRNQGTVPLHAAGPAVGRGWFALPHSISVVHWVFLPLTQQHFYRCLGRSTPCLSPPMDVQINSDNRIFA